MKIGVRPLASDATPDRRRLRPIKTGVFYRYRLDIQYRTEIVYASLLRPEFLCWKVVAPNYEIVLSSVAVEAIIGKDITHTYESETRRTVSLDGVTISAAAGEFVAILGRNGCGKSTLARHVNALIPLQKGSLWVQGFDLSTPEAVQNVRRAVGMVFQNPDNQFVSTVLGEDVAFGLANHCVNADDIEGRVQEALAGVGLEGFAARSPATLSGGQKQRAALAGVLAVDPEILVFDEATSMLDPEGRREILERMRFLHRERGRTIVMITHYACEAVYADRVIVMDGGKIAASGTPREIFADRALLERTGLEQPLPARLYTDLLLEGIALSRCPLTDEELAEELCFLN